jgi:hypothetical protein
VLRHGRATDREVLGEFDDRVRAIHEALENGEPGWVS